jgi:hypothetical protein
MCAAVFPVFALGKFTGLDTATAAVLAAAASLLPHTFYAATYMSEIVQYPVYLVVFCLAIRWLDDQNRLTDFALGFGIGFLLLTKLQGTQFAGAFIIAVTIIAFYKSRAGRNSAGRFLMHSSIVLIAAAVPQGAWNLYKAAHAGTALGAYGRVLVDQRLPYWTARLTAAYFADFLLAPGLVTAVLLFYWIRHNGNFPRTVFVIAVLGVQLIAVSTLDGGLTGWLRERLFMYALPITAVFSARGMAYFKPRQTLLATCAFLGVPLLLIGALRAYPFAVSSIIEVPWANALGSAAGLLPFSPKGLTIAAVVLTVLAASILLKTPKAAPFLFGGYILLFNGLGLVSSSMGLAAWTTRGLRIVSPVLNWLSTNHVRSGDRILIAGRHAYFEDPSSFGGTPQDDMFLDWTWRKGLEEPLEWQIETIGRFDVRMVPAASAIKEEARPGDYLLTLARFDALNLKSSHDPFNLYRIGAVLAQPPSPRYILHIPADRFATGRAPGEFGDPIPGRGAQAASCLVYSPQEEFAPGTYQVNLDVASTASASLSLEVTESGGRVLTRKAAFPVQSRSAAFASDSTRPLEFRVFRRSDPALRFDGLDIEWISRSVQPVSDPLAGTPDPDSAWCFVPNGAFSQAPRSPVLPTANVKGTRCFVDLINGAPPIRQFSIDRQSGIQMVGWAGDVDTGESAEHVYIELFSPTGVSYWARAFQYLRPDVAKAFQKPALSESGFTLPAANLKDIPAGTYHLRVVLLTQRDASSCDLGRDVELR